MLNPRFSQPRKVVQHGTKTMYGKGCRCEDCTGAEKRYRAEHYRKVHGGGDPDRVPQTRKLKEQKTEWMNQAACQERADLAWIPDADDSEDKIHAKKLAKTFCLDCPVRGECLQYGITTKSMGIWGGSYLFWEPRKKVVNLLGLDG
jgi:hypothetical protein